MSDTRSPNLRSRRIAIGVGSVVAGLIALNILAQGLDRAVGGSEPSGVSGSSYSTAADGIGAYASLLVHFDHRIEQQRGAIATHAPSSEVTFIALEPRELTADDDAALLQFVSDGGRLVIGGSEPFYLKNFRDKPPKWGLTGETSWTQIDPSLGSVRTIEAAGQGSWTSTGSGKALVGNSAEALATIDHIGRGDIVFVADPSPLENAYLARADNAAFALALAGDRAVVFAEGVHGYGTTRGFSAIPTRWKVALALLGLAALVFVWSRARRFGPPDKRARDLPPARAEYVRALSLTLERTRDRAGALAPAQHYARDRVATRGALGAQPSDEELTRAARKLGCTDEEIASLLTPVVNDAQVLALGRAAARVSGGDGRSR